MKNNIVDLLTENPKQTFNVRQVAHHLKLESADYKKLRGALKSLVKDGKIIVHPDERYSLRDVNKVLKGVIKVHPNGYGFLIPDSKKKYDVFIPGRHLNFALNGDTVLVESFRSSGDGRFEGRIIQVLERANDVFVGKLIRKNQHFYVVSKDAGTPMEIYIPKKNLLKASVGDLVAVSLEQYPGPGIVPVGEIKQVIGDEENDANLTDAILLKHHIERGFPNEVHKQIQDLDDDVEYELDKGRVDLTDLPIVTIDGITAKDFDDAVCVVKKGQAYVLYVSIADVSEYVTRNSDLDQEACSRATSTYLPDECIPMLPEKLSNGLCSLNPHVYRKTMTAELHFNRAFQFTKARYYKSLIKSHRRCTYEEVQAYFDGVPNENYDKNLKVSFDLMKLLATKLMDQTGARGAMNFDLPEAEVIYDVHGHIQTIQRSMRFFTHRMIEMFMVAANVAVAQLFSHYGLPLLYRIHDKPDSIKQQNFLKLVADLGLGQHLKGFDPSLFFEEMQGHALETFLQTTFLRSLKQAVYDPENIGHFGLALQDYAHFTSPIRRYPDLIVHRQLKALLKSFKDQVAEIKKTDLKKQKTIEVKLPYSFNDLVQLGRHCSDRERSSVDAEREVLKVRRALFAKEFLHDKFFGRVNRVSRYGLVVELDPYYVEGFLDVKDIESDYFIYDEKRICLMGRRTHKKFKIGDRVWVTVSAVEVDSGGIQLALHEKSVKKQKPSNQHKRKKRGRKAQRNKKRSSK